MASGITHIAPALALGTFFLGPSVPRAVWMIGPALAMIPDLDVISFSMGIDYGDLLGHRGFTHSLLFAAMLSLATWGLIASRIRQEVGQGRLLAYFFLCLASHGFLDVPVHAHGAGG